MELPKPCFGSSWSLAGILSRFNSCLWACVFDDHLLHRVTPGYQLIQTFWMDMTVSLFFCSWMQPAQVWPSSSNPVIVRGLLPLSWWTLAGRLYDFYVPQFLFPTSKFVLLWQCRSDFRILATVLCMLANTKAPLLIRCLCRRKLCTAVGTLFAICGRVTLLPVFMLDEHANASLWIDPPLKLPASPLWLHPFGSRSLGRHRLPLSLVWVLPQICIGISAQSFPSMHRPTTLTLPATILNLEMLSRKKITLTFLNWPLRDSPYIPNVLSPSPFSPLPLTKVSDPVSP